MPVDRCVISYNCPAWGARKGQRASTPAATRAKEREISKERGAPCRTRETAVVVFHFSTDSSITPPARSST
jgi:hypothetical protein